MAPASDTSSRDSGSMISDYSPAPISRPRNVEIIEIDDDSEESEPTGERSFDEDDELSDDQDEEDMEDEEEDEEGDSEMEMDVEDSYDEDEEEEEGGHLDEMINGTYHNGMNGATSFGRKHSALADAEPDIITLSSSESPPPSLLRPAEIQEALHPLRRTADRVAKQIEAFANSLDNFRRQAHHPSDPRTFREACKLVKKYQEIAEETVKRLSKPAGGSRKSKVSALTGLKGSKENSTQTRSEKTEEEIRRWQLEAETWELVYYLLSVDDPDSIAKAQQSQEFALQSLHRYSTDSEVWEQFLAADQFALEHVLVLKWLEKSSRSSTNDIDAIIAKLEKDAGCGDGSWSHGWLYTKEAIKGAKRLRSWPQPLDPDDPTVTASLLSSDQNEPLITQLDPDAITRQRLGLLKQDQLHEQATWLTCWKMLRLGESWSSISDWANERLEGWRAVSLSGASPTLSGNKYLDSSLVRMMNYRSQESWRAACSDLANNPNTNIYERAVYALISGETGPAYEVCQSWSDFLYVFCNNVILSRYREFCKQFQRKLSYAPSAKVKLNVEPTGHESIRNFLHSLVRDERTSSEAKNPYRTIQSMILGQNYDSFFYHQANATAKIASETKKPTLISKSTIPTGFDDHNLIVANDDDSLRILAHLNLLLQSIGLLRCDSYYLENTSANVVRYIDLLRKSENRELIPLYASLLPKEVGHEILGKVLIEVVKPKERLSHIQQMTRLNIDIPAVFHSQWRWVLAEADAKEDTSKPIKLRRTVENEPDGLGKIGPIKKGLVGHIVTHEEENLIRCLDWHRYVNELTPRLCILATGLYKRFFHAGRLAATRELCNRLEVSKIPDVATNGFTRDEGMEDDGSRYEGGGLSSPTKANLIKSPSKRRSLHDYEDTTATLSEKLSVQVETLGELEQLVWAFDALEKWGDQMDEYSNASDSERKREIRKTLQGYLDRVTAAVEPLCRDWLVCSKDEAEEKELEFIRNTYLPEVTLAYHSALYYAGHTIGREILVQCMTLATVVADSPTLTNSFVSSGRMRELVDALALSSVAIMGVNADTKIKRKLPRKAHLDLWKTKPIEGEGISTGNGNGNWDENGINYNDEMPNAAAISTG